MIFRNRQHIGLFLLLIYFFSISPLVRFHNHDYQVTNYEEADVCEKAIYYGNTGDDINHAGHLSTDLTKCFIDTEHTGSAHFSVTFESKTFSPTLTQQKYFFTSHPYLCGDKETCGRDPPQLV